MLEKLSFVCNKISLTFMFCRLRFKSTWHKRHAQQVVNKKNVNSKNVVLKKHTFYEKI